MNGDDDDLLTFLKGFGFSEELLSEVLDLLDACKSGPGTTLKRYMNRVIATIGEEDRSAFLKGIMVGVAIRRAADAFEEPELTDEERRIESEIERLR
jgi:hypothetical protein